MCIIILSSTNPKFSFILNKNPKSGMQIRTLRKGFAFGFYKNDSNYLVYFKDKVGEMSYGCDNNNHQQYDYLNK